MNAINNRASENHSMLAKGTFCLIFAGSALLTGCSVLPDKPVRAAAYDFGPGARAQPAAAVAAPLPALALADIDTPASLAGTALLYRLAYADGQALRPYAEARWSAPPAQLVRQRLRGLLGQERAVVGVGEGAPGLTLRLELEEFSQVFDAPDRAIGLVRLRATLVETGSGRERRISQRQVVAEAAAPTPDAAGGVRALTAATDTAAQELARWLRQLPAAR
jgi:cholesterol transport system auxiliary component